MKKAFPVLVLLVALVAVIAFTMRRTGGGTAAFPASRAAELAPAEAVAYLEISDLARTAERWQQNELRAITDEPDWDPKVWREILQQWAPPTPAEDWLGRVLIVAGEMKTTDPAGLFLVAAGPEANPWSRVLAGLTYRGKKSDMEGAMRRLKEELRRAWPAATSELTKYEGVEIESIHSGLPPVLIPLPEYPSAVGPGDWDRGYKRFPWQKLGVPLPLLTHSEIHLAYRDNWVFFSTDRALLAETMDRYLGKPGTKSLATEPHFAEGQRHRVPDSDLIAWARWEPMGRLWADGMERRPALANDLAQTNEVHALHYSAKLDGPVFRDRLYCHLAKPPRMSPLAKPSPAVTTPNTFLCGTIHFEWLRGRIPWVHRRLPDEFQRQALRDLLARSTVTMDELSAAFTPALAVMSREGSANFQEYALALEVRDPAKVQELLGRVVGPETPGQSGANLYAHGWKQYPNSGPAFLPPMMLTKTHLLIGLTPRALHNFEQTDGETIEANPAYLPAVQNVGAADAMLFFVDTQKFFARSSRRGQPETKVELADLGRATDALRIFRMPAKPIERHLRPTAVSVRVAGPGWLIEGTGPAGLLGCYYFADWMLDARPTGSAWTLLATGGEGEGTAPRR